MLKTNTPIQYGDSHDGVVEFVALTYDNGAIEVGCYLSDDKLKHIIGISSQIGCPSRCTFCELGSEAFTRNLTAQEIYEQVGAMKGILHELQVDISDKPLKVSIAKTGEPLFNPNLVDALDLIAAYNASYKISTVFPDSATIEKNLETLACFATTYTLPIQLQISLLSTNEEQRKSIAGIPVADFYKIRRAGEMWKEKIPNARDINLSIIVSEHTICEVEDIKDIFDPQIFRFRFRPYIPTSNGTIHSLEQISTQRLETIKNRFRQEGYIASDWPTPTQIEQRHNLAANVTRKRWLESFFQKK